MKPTKEMTDDELREEIEALKNLIEETNQKTASIKENNDKQVLKIIELCEAIVSKIEVGR